MRRAILLAPKITVFAFGEGKTEDAFLKYIKSLYGRRPGIFIKVNCGSGKSPKIVLDQAIRNGALQYDRRFIFLDTDVVWKQEVKDKAKIKKIELIPSTPCTEGFLLSLIEPNFNSTIHSSKECKRLFHKKYLTKTEKLDHRNYKKLLPVKKLEFLRKKDKILDKIIRLMTTT